jgi:hypothetical protein
MKYLPDSAEGKRIKLIDEYTLIVQEPLDKPNTFVNVKQKKLAGFSSDSNIIFVREESVDLWKALNNAVTEKINLMVNGPPGTGKSTEAWAWALWIATTNKTKVTWFHAGHADAVKVLIDGIGEKITTSSFTQDIENSEGTLLVFDGVTKECSKDVHRACSRWRKKDPENRVFVTVSSVSVVIPSEQLKEANIVAVTVGSWTFQQYQNACENDDFYNEVKPNLICEGMLEDGRTSSCSPMIG